VIFSIPIDVSVSGTHWGIAGTTTQGKGTSEYTNTASLSARSLMNVLPFFTQRVTTVNQSLYTHQYYHVNDYHENK
jgi:hypothetical protein